MKATKAFFNGEVITVDPQFSVHEAVAVYENHILSVGTNEKILATTDENTEIIDLEGKSLLPGFIDAHAHLELYGTNLLGVNGKEVEDIHELQEKLKDAAQMTPRGEWIRGWGYNQNNLAEGRHLSRWDLDEVSTEHPIIVVRTCGHISCVNSKALELAGINNSPADPPGGKYVRENGKLTGLLLEAAHMNMFLFANYSEAEILKGLELASQDYLTMGITSVHDAGGYGPDHIRYLQTAVQDNKVKQRVYALYGSLKDSPDMVRKGLESGMMTGLGDEWFKIGPAKVFIDGSSSGPTARTRAPYTSNPKDSGILYLNQEELDSILGKAHEKGWQVTAHAIGDQAVEMMIKSIHRALKRNPRTDHRHRIEHAGMAPPDLVEKIKALEVVPIPNPAFIYEFGDGYIKDYGERIHTIFPLKSFAESGIPFAIGSDSPITTVNPLYGIHAAVNRRSKSGSLVGDTQKITVQEAIKAYTWYGAYASNEDHLKGSIEVGKLADFVVLSNSILESKPDRLKDLQVEMTVLDGEIVVSNSSREAVR
ncbi:amidohydrolase [Pseudalkalibacillus salsuginis]|uniref:amidohydrolase n=1 Tax=Pseudalkalibacillus salsuginis TaxID=2910972 RepID=UPI001F45A3B6|nr:amidohydrolase [Pseudalkalibacillus salsuginis]MCF6408943.1 amidohydrolase [Pseudalkalibacillus salsuginis]